MSLENSNITSLYSNKYAIANNTTFAVRSNRVNRLFLKNIHITLVCESLKINEQQPNIMIIIEMEIGGYVDNFQHSFNDEPPHESLIAINIIIMLLLVYQMIFTV